LVLPFDIDVPPNVDVIKGLTPSELNPRIAQDVTVLREAFTPNGGIVITVHDQYGKLNDFSIA